MKGVHNTFNASDFQTMEGKPGFYTPFDDSIEGWTRAREFIDWLAEGNYDMGFNGANCLARKYKHKFKAWLTLQRILGEK